MRALSVTPRGLQRLANRPFSQALAKSLAKTDGPTLIGVRIDDKPGVGTTRRDPVQIRERFMHGMGVREPL